MNISPKTLTEFKKEVNKFKAVVDAIAEVWPSSKITMMSVLIQNLGFNGIGSLGHIHEIECQRVDKIIYALTTLAEYDRNDHTTNYIANEIYMMFEGYTYSVDMDISYSDIDNDESLLDEIV